MNRRSFFTILTGGLASLLAPKLAPAPEKKWKWHKYGIKIKKKPLSEEEILRRKYEWSEKFHKATLDECNMAHIHLPITFEEWKEHRKTPMPPIFIFQEDKI